MPLKISSAKCRPFCFGPNVIFMWPEMQRDFVRCPQCAMQLIVLSNALISNIFEYRYTKSVLYCPEFTINEDQPSPSLSPTAVTSYKVIQGSYRRHAIIQDCLNIIYILWLSQTYSWWHRGRGFRRHMIWHCAIPLLCRRYATILDHYSYVIMRAMASQITCLSIVCTTVCLGAVQRKKSKLRVTGLFRGIHRSPVNSSYKGLVTPKLFPFDDVIMLKISKDILTTNPWYDHHVSNYIFMPHTKFIAVFSHHIVWLSHNNESNCDVSTP